MEAEEVNTLFRVWKTLMQMLQDRHYEVSEADLAYTRESFGAMLGESKSRERLVRVVNKQENLDEKLMVLFPDETRITVPIIANIAQKMHNEAIQRTIMITKGNITPTAKNAIVEVSSHFTIEYFEEKELLVNITEHELVPKHIVMTEEEKQALLTRYRVKETQLPKIQVTDPVARYFGLSRGQVFKIIRNSETAGKYVTYRLAV